MFAQALDHLKLQMCDLKWEHFGIALNLSTSSGGYDQGGPRTFVRSGITPIEVKLLDLDAVLSRSSLKLNMDNTLCENDEDCDYFDCKGTCIEVNKIY